MCHLLMRGGAHNAEKPAVERNDKILDDTNRGDESADIEIEAKIVVKYSVSWINHNNFLHD